MSVIKKNKTEKIIKGFIKVLTESLPPKRKKPPKKKKPARKKK